MIETSVLRLLFLLLPPLLFDGGIPEELKGTAEKVHQSPLAIHFQWLALSQFTSSTENFHHSENQWLIMFRWTQRLRTTDMFEEGKISYLKWKHFHLNFIHVLKIGMTFLK